MVPSYLYFRAIKSFCYDFDAVRKVLCEIGAVFVEAKDQVDYYFNLPKRADVAGEYRLRLREENGVPHIMYYYDRNAYDTRTVPVVGLPADAQLKEFLVTALGVRTVVAKKREVWQRGDVVFNLDTVHNVGDIIEVEIVGAHQQTGEGHASFYRSVFGPYLGPEITVSNEDLITSQSS
ncbi:MAG: CYTH domain-containing protein [Chloroflexi bacterium]|nr:CYTH domain-containing protein [Chloroflexota bacterium]